MLVEIDSKRVFNFDLYTSRGAQTETAQIIPWVQHASGSNCSHLWLVTSQQGRRERERNSDTYTHAIKITNSSRQWERETVEYAEQRGIQKWWPWTTNKTGQRYMWCWCSLGVLGWACFCTCRWQWWWERIETYCKCVWYYAVLISYLKYFWYCTHIIYVNKVLQPEAPVL